MPFSTTNPVPCRRGAVGLMRPAQRDREFVADFLRKTARLGETQMLLVPQPVGLRQGEHAPVDEAGSGSVGEGASPSAIARKPPSRT